MQEMGCPPDRRFWGMPVQTDCLLSAPHPQSDIANLLICFYLYVIMKSRIDSSKASSSTLPAFGEILMISSPKWQHSQSSKVGWRQWRRNISFPVYPYAEDIQIERLFLSHLCLSWTDWEVKAARYGDKIRGFGTRQTWSVFPFSSSLALWPETMNWLTHSSSFSIIKTRITALVYRIVWRKREKAQVCSGEPRPLWTFKQQ